MRLAEKVLTPKEMNYCKSKKPEKIFVQHLAGRIAAKESVFKAVSGFKKVVWKDIEILNKAGLPVISGTCILAGFLKSNNFRCSLSISHERDFAVAHAILWDNN